MFQISSCVVFELGRDDSSSMVGDPIQRPAVFDSKDERVFAKEVAAIKLTRYCLLESVTKAKDMWDDLHNW